MPGFKLFLLGQKYFGELDVLIFLGSNILGFVHIMFS